MTASRTRARRGKAVALEEKYAVTVPRAAELAGVPLSRLRALISIGFVLVEEIGCEEFITRSELAHLALLPK